MLASFRHTAARTHHALDTKLCIHQCVLGKLRQAS